jgi:hypothetical protein
VVDRLQDTQHWAVDIERQAGIDWLVGRQQEDNQAELVPGNLKVNKTI